MGIEQPPNIMKAGERPARVRTGAKTATKSQERGMLDKLAHLAQDPTILVPQWLGPGSSPFQKLERKLRKVQSKHARKKSLGWSARGNHLWNAYAASLIVLDGGKVPSFASLKLRGRDVKFVYRRGARRNKLIGVQLFDDPQARLLGYADTARKRHVYILSGEDALTAAGRGAVVPTDVMVQALENRGLQVEVRDEIVGCAHAHDPTWRYRYELADLGWHAELCLACVRKIGGNFTEALEARVLGPTPKLPVVPRLRGRPYALQPEASVDVYQDLGDQAFDAAYARAQRDYESYSDIELADWTREELLKVLQGRPEGFLLVGDELWLASFEEAAERYAESELERSAIQAAFRLEPPRLRVSDKSVHKILEPYWKKHARALLAQLSKGLLKERELADLERLAPSEALASLARMLAARERFKEFLQFDELHPSLDFVVTCLQIQRAGEKSVFATKLQEASRDTNLRILALSVARNLGEQATLEWQYAPHEKDAASFLDPYVRDVVSSSPAQFGETLTRLAGALNVPAPSRTQA